MKRSRPLQALGLALAITTAFCSSASMAQTMNPRQSSVQMFRWSWADIEKECPFLGSKGVGGVQISPPQESKIAGAWWEMYQPVNYQKLESRMGTEAQLKKMVDTCHANGVRVYVDVVLNHMASGNKGFGLAGSAYDPNALQYPEFGPDDFHNNCSISDQDYNLVSADSRHNVMFCRLSSLRDLKSESPKVIATQASYLNHLLRQVGVDGFRLDAAKHIQPEALKALFVQVFNATNLGEPVWVTSEVIRDANAGPEQYFDIGRPGQQVTVNEFKFAYAMKKMLHKDGAGISNIRDIMGSWGNWGGSWGFIQPSKATVFVNNWDTERAHDKFGTPTPSSLAVRWDTNGAKTYDLANILMLAWPYGEAQLHSGYRWNGFDDDRPSDSPFASDGTPLINVKWDFVHRWRPVINMVGFRNATQGQAPGNYTTGTAHQLAFSRGNKGFIAMNNEPFAWSRTFQTGLPAGQYCNILQGQLNSTGTECVGGGRPITVNTDGTANLTVSANNTPDAPAIAIDIEQKIGTSTCPSNFCPSKTPIDYDNTQAKPGGQLVLYYKGSLSNSSNLNMIFNWDNAGSSTVAMSKNANGYWQAPAIAWPAAASKLSMSFSNGSQTDANNGSNYSITTCTTVPVTFKIANGHTIWGQNIHVTGNRQILGNWGTSDTNKLNIQGSGADAPWSRTFQMPPNVRFQYKYIKHGAVADVWERNFPTPSGNREAVTPSCGQSLELNDGNFAF